MGGAPTCSKVLMAVLCYVVLQPLPLDFPADRVERALRAGIENVGVAGRQPFTLSFWSKSQSSDCALCYAIGHSGIAASISPVSRMVS